MGRSPVMNLLTCSACYSACFTSTYWVISRYEKQIQRIEHIQSTSPRCPQYDILDILANTDGFDLFASHLVNEFATENLAFIFEMMQIKQQCVKSNLISIEYIGFIVTMPIDRINKLKRDNIEIDSIYKLKNNIKYIMMQYILLGAEHCVNIASFTRFRIINAFDKLETMTPRNTTSEDTVVYNENAENREECNIQYLVQKYLMMFDEAMNEVIDLLKTDPLTRFYRSKQYQMLLKDDV